MKIAKQISLVLCLLLLLIGNTFAQGLTIRVDRNSVGLGESFRLLLTLNGQGTSSTEPDLTLLKKNFAIIGTSQSQQISMINGVTTKEIQWRITLIPQTVGTITIPAISVGKFTSKPIKINVTQTSQQITSGKQQNVFVETSVNNKQPYVKSNILYTVKIYYDLPIANATLIPPKVADAQIKPFGKDIQYQTRYNRKPYQVLERTFLITPQKAGEITITPAMLRGRKASDYTSTNRFDTFFGGTPGQPFVVTGDQVKLNVRPKPAAAAGKWWLPATDVKLTQTWSPQLTEAKVGEPITRTITIAATGATADALPSIQQTNLDHVNSYPETKPVLQTEQQGTDILGKRIEKIVYIPTSAGKITVPELNIHWWNTQTDKEEIAALPTQTLVVQTAAITKEPSPPSPAQAIKTSKSETANLAPQGIVLAQSKSPSKLWIGLSAGLLLLWIITLITWRWTSKIKSQSDTRSQEAHEDYSSEKQIDNLNRKQLLQGIKQGCLQNNPIQTKDSLIKWATYHWRKPFHNLLEIGKQLNVENVERAFAQLDEHSYSENQTSWDGNVFWQLFITHINNNSNNEHAKKSSAKEQLAGLYLGPRAKYGLLSNNHGINTTQPKRCTSE